MAKTSKAKNVGTKGKRRKKVKVEDLPKAQDELAESDLKRVSGGGFMHMAAGTQDAMKRVLFGAAGLRKPPKKVRE